MCPEEARCESRGDVRAKGGQGRVPPSALPACSCGPAPPRGASAVSPLSPTTWRPSGVPFVRVTQAGGPQHLQPQRSLCDSPLLCEPGGCPAGVQVGCPAGRRQGPLWATAQSHPGQALSSSLSLSPRAGALSRALLWGTQDEINTEVLKMEPSCLHPTLRGRKSVWLGFQEAGRGGDGILDKTIDRPETQQRGRPGKGQRSLVSWQQSQ